MRAVNWQRFEGLVMCAGGLIVYFGSGGQFGWWALLVFFAPDIAIAGYLLGPRVGAACYNLVHIYAFGIALFALGLIIGMPFAAPLGLLWFAHAGFDRMLGYGLKSMDSFKETHLGDI